MVISKRNIIQITTNLILPAAMYILFHLFLFLRLLFNETPKIQNVASDERMIQGYRAIGGTGIG